MIANIGSGCFFPAAQDFTRGASRIKLALDHLIEQILDFRILID
jgi:hypothetical protein